MYTLPSKRSMACVSPPCLVMVESSSLVRFQSYIWKSCSEPPTRTRPSPRSSTACWYFAFEPPDGYQGPMPGDGLPVAASVMAK